MRRVTRRSAFPGQSPRPASWIAVLDEAARKAALRAELREIPLDPDLGSNEIPWPGDRVAILALPDAVFLAIATAARVRPGGRPVLRLRDRIRAPDGNAVDPFAMRPRPACSASWTRGDLPAMAGRSVGISALDADRIASAIRAKALAFGPPPTRPAHAKARTPGRRALVEGRAASGTLGGRAAARARAARAPR